MSADADGRTVRFASGLSRHPDAAVAVAEAVGSVVDSLGVGPDLAVVFVSGRTAEVFDDVVAAVGAILSPRALLAATAIGILAGSEEVERHGAIAVWAGQVGPVVPFRLETVPGVVPTVIGLPRTIEAGSTLLVLADPYTFPAGQLIRQLAGTDVIVAGGLASLGPGANRLALDHRHDPAGGNPGCGRPCIRQEGAVGVVLPPDVAWPVVSQGCRPVGRSWTVTAGRGPLIAELGGRPARQRVDEMVAELSPRDRFCASGGLHIGLVAHESADDSGRGDFVVRGVLGSDPATGAVAVEDEDEIEIGQLVQFQVSDAESAHEDLVELLGSVDAEGQEVGGALVFTGDGRGTRMFEQPHHDAALVNELAHGRGVAGMFCAGELGPIGSLNALHRFTATVLLFPATVQRRS